MSTVAPPPATDSVDAAAHADADVWSRYRAYLRRPPEVTVEWHDRETPARGWLVVNSLRGGAAGGGTRMRDGLVRDEVVYLAKTMELKFAFSGPPIGGAKSGIDFDPRDPRRDGVLRRWYEAIAPYLATRYGTGGDLNVDEVRDVAPGCAAAGVPHPQTGVVRGHFGADPARAAEVLAALDRGVHAPVLGAEGLNGLDLPVADLVTGYGVARSVVHVLRTRGEPVEGTRVKVEGWGTVGGPCALYLAREGARIVGLSDRDRALLDPAGLDAARTEALLRRRGTDKLLPADDGRCAEGPERDRFWDEPADVLVCAAASGTLDEARLERLASCGVRVVACGANQPFREAEFGATGVQRAADRRFTIVPDVIANCGMARAFSFLMEQGTEPEAGRLFRAVDRTVGDALAETVRRAGAPTGLLAAALDLAMERVTSP